MLSENVQKVFEKYNGTLPTKIAELNGINKETLRKAYTRGDIERPMRGVYLLPGDILDTLFACQTTYPKGIYSHESAMMLHRYGTFTPEVFHLTFPRGYHAASFNENTVHPYFVSKEVFSLGLTTATTWLGNDVLVYDKERTLLDVLHSPHVHPSLVKDMLTDYFYDEEKDLDKLASYATLLKRTKLLEEVLIAYA